MEHSFTISVKEAGERIDKYLCRKLPKFSRKQIKALIDGGRVRVGLRRVVIAGWEVTEGDHVEVRVPEGLHDKGEQEAGEQEVTERAPARPRAHAPASKKIGASIDRFLERQKRRTTMREEIQAQERKGRKGRRKPKGREQAREEKRLKVYHHDRDIIVVEKPAGVLSVPKDRARGRGTLRDMIRTYIKRKIKGARHSFISPLHRLDAETSGVMVFALSKAGQKLSRQFKNHSIERSYKAVVEGQVKKESGAISKTLEKGEFGHGKKVRTASGGMKAVTEYTVRERYSSATLLDIRVRTGRTHQIRVHLAGDGHPIIGDALYAGGKKKEGEMSFGRHALHAHYLSFKHPVTGKRVSQRSPLPEDMRELVDRLRESG